MLNEEVSSFLKSNQIEGFEIVYSQDSWIIKFKNWLGYHRKYSDEFPSDQDKIELMYEFGVLLGEDIDVLHSWDYEPISVELEVCWVSISSTLTSIITQVCTPGLDALKVSNTIIEKESYIGFYEFIYKKLPYVSISSSKCKQIGIPNPLELIISSLYNYNIEGIFCNENHRGDRLCFLVLSDKATGSEHTFSIPQTNFSNDVSPGEVIEIDELYELSDLYFESSFLKCLLDCSTNKMSKYLDIDSY